MTAGKKRSVVVCVCTFRRPHIANTLQSLAGLALPEGVELSVIVADNDVVQSARPAVELAAAGSNLSIDYIHAPARNISVARNACLELARGDWIAFVDDDEVVSPHWLGSLLDASESADVVFGPVDALYGKTTPKWILRGTFHSARPVFERGHIRTGYTGNVLIRRSALLLTGARFDLAAGATGGEDTVFFGRLFDAGLRLTYAPGALASEPVPAERQTLGWLLRRAFRSGRSHARMLARRGGIPRPVRTGLSAAKTTACCVGTAFNLWSSFGWRRWFIRGAMHAGMTCQFAGL